jgi:hypothetical protein
MLEDQVIGCKMMVSLWMNVWKVVLSDFLYNRVLGYINYLFR